MPQVDKNVGETFTVNLLVEDAKDVASSGPIQIQYDPKVISLSDAAAGKFLSGDGKDPMLTKNVQNDLGVANLQLRRPPGAPGMAGMGTLLTLTFKAVAKGATNITSPNVTIYTSMNQIAGSGSPRITVNVK